MPLFLFDETGVGQLTAADGRLLAHVLLRDDDGEPVARDVHRVGAASADEVAHAVRRELGGRRLETDDEALVDALVATGLTRGRAADDLRHDLSGLPAARSLPAGWALAAPGWDDDLAEALHAAYAEHPDGAWTHEDTQAVRGMLERQDPVPALAPATARLVDAAGRSAGHVLVAGPVPWTEDVCGWVLNLAVAPRAQGQGLGRALLEHALRGTREAGLPSLDLQVVHGGPGRRLYDAAGFRLRARVLAVDVP